MRFLHGRLTSPLTKEEATKPPGRTLRSVLLAVLALVVLGCDISVMLPSGPAFPTPAPGEVQTIVAGTAGAAQTQTAALLPATVTPTLTATVTRTPTPTPTFTPTFLFSLGGAAPKKTATSTLGATTGQYSCNLLAQDPDDGTRFDPNRKFDAVWEVRNTGSSAWTTENVDFAYVSGRKMYDNDVYDLPFDVNTGGSVNLVVHMTAPKISGTFKTVWTLRRGGNDFCHLDLTIEVK